MKKRVINAAICDARGVSEESLKAYASTEINAAVLIVGERAKELLNRYPVAINVASTIELADGENVEIRTVNGSDEIGPNTDGTGVFLIVNGKLTVESESLDAMKSFSGIFVNGKIQLPRSMRGLLQNMTVNGSTEYYPDGAVILKADTVVDSLFAARADHSLYYCPGTLFFLDGAAAETLSDRNIRFEAKKFVVSEGAAAGIAALFNEGADIVRVPDGTAFVEGNVELQPSVVRKYGSRLCVSGGVTVNDAQALSQVSYLFADGTVQVNKALEDAFRQLDCDCGGVKIFDPDRGHLCDRIRVKIGTSVLKKYPGGVDVEDCVKVVISKDLTPDEIMEKLSLSDCALVCCSAEQEEAVSMVSQDVAEIKVLDEEEGGSEITLIDEKLSVISGEKDAQVINAAQYKM